MTFSLDANVVIDVLRGDPTVRDRWSLTAPGDVDLVLSAVVLHEIESGLARHPDAARQRARLAPILARTRVVDFEGPDATVSGALSARLKQTGRSIGALDTLIAGQALARGWTVVTRNVRHFGRVEGLPLIDWAEGPDPLTPARIAERVAQED